VSARATAARLSRTRNINMKMIKIAFRFSRSMAAEIFLVNAP
jgi:hypothetical protein